MIFFKKEKEVIVLIVKHTEIVEDCLLSAAKAIDSYLKDDIDSAKRLAQQVDRIETRADLVRYEMRDKLYSGAYLPRLREDIYRLVESLDEVADAGEACCDFFLNQRPVFPDELKPLFFEVSQESLGIIKPLKAAILCFIKGECSTKVIREHAKEVGLKESEVDQIEWNLTKQIFTSTLDHSHKLHLRRCLEIIASVSDLAEDVTDQLDLVTLKSMI
jgi:predicted phosphate transport protein (TIGR00153 family)